MKSKLFSLFLAMAMVGSLTACSQSAELAEAEIYAMNTVITLSASGGNAEDAIAQARRDIIDWESLWSVTVDTSELYQINHSEGQSVEVSQTTADLISFTLSMSERTGGSLDPTIYPIVSAWGFTTSSFQVPTQEEINKCLQLVGYEKVNLTENTVTMLPGMQLDLGATAKGYACDLVAENFRRQGVTSALINFGGNIAMIGNSSDGDAWRIGVRDPDGGDDLGVLSLSDCGVATSGNYQRYFEDENGNRYGHIMNPETGYPIMSNLRSVTIVSEEGKICDALSTAVYVMGIDRAIELWESSNDFEMILIADDQTVYVSEGISDRFTLAENSPLTLQVLNR